MHLNKSILALVGAFFNYIFLAMLAAIVVLFILTMAVAKKRGVDKEAEAVQSAAEAEAAAELANA